METERDREPLLPVQSLKGWGHCWVLVEEQSSCGGGQGAALQCRRPLYIRTSGKHSSRKHHSIINRKHTPTHPHTYPSVRSTSIPKCTHEVTHNYKEAHTFPQTCWRSGIVALRVISWLIEGSKPTSSISGTGGLVILGGMTQARTKKSVEETLLGDVGRRGRVSPETPAPFGVLLAQDLLLTFALLLRAQIAVLLL